MESLISVDSGSPEMQLDRAGLGQAELHHGAGGPLTAAARPPGAPGILASLLRHRKLPGSGRSSQSASGVIY